MKKSETFDMRSAMRTMCIALGIAGVLWFLGRGALSTPPVSSWSQFQRWLGERSTAESAIAALRATAVVAACYLGIVTGLTIVAKVASIEHLDRVARWLVPRSLRPLLGLAVGAGVATAAASMTVPRDAEPTRVATVTLEAPTDATATMYFVTESVPATSIATALASTTSTPVTLSPVPTFTPATLPEHAPAAPMLAAPPTWTIAPGEHLWAVARETLADSWHRAPTDAEVTPYWRALIEINRSRLIDPSNADYVLAGQSFVLPDVPAAPGK
ncbi:MAG TPA: hypothetical protein VM282_01000 [Acidimicrobiales bacterium]|nr:hypothetical protein [Acidimicrobiales bacterium]